MVPMPKATKSETARFTAGSTFALALRSAQIRAEIRGICARDRQVTSSLRDDTEADSDHRCCSDAKTKISHPTALPRTVFQCFSKQRNRFVPRRGHDANITDIRHR
jgi:hypothetical protein